MKPHIEIIIYSETDEQMDNIKEKINKILMEEDDCYDFVIKDNR